jgi:hypothetical protein
MDTAEANNNTNKSNSQKPKHFELSQIDLLAFLHKVAVHRPVFIWGPPGIGKSAIVHDFAKQIGLECVALLGSQLSPEDIIGIPQMMDGTFRYCPPRMIARHEAYCLFLDEFNACSTEVQKVFYTLIHDRRIGEFILPEGSVVVAAGNRAEDHAIVMKLSSALVNRMVHVHLQPSIQDWIDWSKVSHLHPLVVDYIEANPNQLAVGPSDDEQPFSTPRAWHMLSDSLSELEYDCPDNIMRALCLGTLSEDHVDPFLKFIHGKMKNCSLNLLLADKNEWPFDKARRHYLRYMIWLLKRHLSKHLPEQYSDLKESDAHLLEISKAKIKKLYAHVPDLAAEILFNEEGNTLPAWFIKDFNTAQVKEKTFGLRA